LGQQAVPLAGGIARGVINRLSTSERSELGYLAAGDEGGSMEMFAEIYAQTKTSASKAVGEAHRRALIGRLFPEMIEAVRALDLP
jgi:hypothetical protein